MSKNKNLAIALGIVAVVVLVVVSLLSSADTRSTNNDAQKVKEISNFLPGEEEEIQSAISARKCKRLGGVWVQEDIYGWISSYESTTPEWGVVAWEWSCVISGNAAASLPVYDAPGVATGEDSPIGNDTNVISMRKCKKLGGTVVLVSGTNDWYCKVPIAGINLLYDATIGKSEPINSDTLLKEKRDIETILKLKIID